MGAVTDFIQEHGGELSGYIRAGVGIAVIAGTVWSALSDSDEGTGTYTEFSSEAVEQQEEALSRLEKEKEATIRRRKEEEKKQKKCMEDWLEGSETILDNIGNYRAELFLPGCEGNILEAIARAQELSEAGAKQAALAAAYNAYSFARRTEESLLEYELEWETAYTSYKKIRCRLDAFVSECSDYQLEVQTSRGAERILIDVDYWVRGKVSGLAKQAPPLELPRTVLTEKIYGLTARAEELLEQMRELLPEAATAFYDSQQRTEMCEAVFDYADRRGFRLCSGDSYGYEDGDDRNPVFLKMCNALKDEVLFTFSEGGGFGVSMKFSGVKNRDLQQYLLQLCLDALAEGGFSVTEYRDLTV